MEKMRKEWTLEGKDVRLKIIFTKHNSISQNNSEHKKALEKTQ